MGSFCGKGDPENETLRILVLGISGSGKSTFSKQMKILYDEITQEERLMFVNIIRINVLIGMKELAEQADHLGLSVKEKYRKYVRYFKENNVSELELSDQNVLKKVKALWADDAIQQTWEACRNYQIQVSQLDYCMKNLDRITESDFIPNDEDIVRSRQRTTGAYSTKFQYENTPWEIFDVGGQVPERKKWNTIVSESDFTTIIYFAALDEYNMESNETKDGDTKMEVSLKVFNEILNDKATYNCCSILFLNKIDLFKDKIQSPKGFEEFEEKFPDFGDYMKKEFEKDIAIESYLNEYIKIDEDEDKVFWGGVKYLEKKFKEEIDDDEIRKQLVVFPTCAIEKDHIEKVFKATSDYIFDLRMKLSGIKW